MGKLKRRLMEDISGVVSALNLSNDAVKKGEVRNLLNPILVEHFPELTPLQANSISTVVVHFIYKDFGLMRGELQSITTNDLKHLGALLEEERIGQLFIAESAVREGVAKSWNVNARGILMIQPIPSKEPLSIPSNLSVP